MLKRTLGSERVVQIGGVTAVAGSLCGWAGVACDVMPGPVQYLCRLDTICSHGDLPAAHDNLECFICAGDDFVQDAVWWVQGTAYGVLP